MIEKGSSDYWRATIALAIGSFMVFASVYTTQPLLPLIAQTFEISALHASASFTVSTLMLGLSLLVYGPLSDALGRRNIMLISLSGVVLTTLLLTQVGSYEELLLLRAVQGFMLGGLPAIAIAYLGDEFSRPAMIAAVGLYISGNTLGGIGGRLIGGTMGEWLGWHSAFWAMSVVTVVCFVLFWWLLPKSRGFQKKPLSARRAVGNLARHVKNPMLLPVYLFGGLNFFIFINQYSYATFLLADEPYNLSPFWLGLLFLTYLSGTVGASFSGRFSQWWSQPAVMAAGVIVMMVGSLVTLLDGVTFVVGGFLISAFGFFVAHSTASSWVGAHGGDARASASSLYLVFYYLGASTGGLYLQPFWSWSGWSGVIMGSLLVLTVTLSCAFWLCLMADGERTAGAVVK